MENKWQVPEHKTYEELSVDQNFFNEILKTLCALNQNLIAVGKLLEEIKNK